MGRAKDHQMHQEGKFRHALSLCLEEGAIAECPVHDGEYIDSMEFLEPEELAAKILDANPAAIDSFEDRADMVECVREAMASAGEECGYCAINRGS